MSLTQYLTLGQSGLRVSPICLGTMTFGTQWGWGSDDKESTRILDTYLDRGGNFLDTANIYTKGYSESFLGNYFANKAAAASNQPRDRVVIATKFMGNLYPGDPNGGGGGRKSVIAACEQSLRRLRTDYIDLYWAHFWDKHTPLAETLRAMEDLVKAGKVRYLGLSDHPAWICAHAQHLLKESAASPLIALQIEYSLAQRSVEAELLPMAQYFGLGVTPWSPLKSGVLSGKFTRDAKPQEETRIQEGNKHLSEHNLRIVDVLLKVAEELSESKSAPISAAQVAIRWLIDRPGVVSPIIGARTLSQLEDNLESLEITLSDEQTERLDEVSSVSHPFPHDFLEMIKSPIHGGIEINGEKPAVWDLAPKTDSERS